MTYLADKHIASAACIRLIIGICLAFVVATTGCTGTKQIKYDTEHTAISLNPGDLEHGIGFLTPSAATGREADKQALAMSFSKKLQEMHPDIKVLPLPNVLSAVNAADLDGEYKLMYRDYLETGILEGSILRRVSEVTDVRYFAQLSLASFSQYSQGRFSFLGLRVSHTEIANLRAFIQIWDAHNANIAWEGYAEVNYAYETGAQNPVTFSDVAGLVAERIFSELPGAEEE